MRSSLRALFVLFLAAASIPAGEEIKEVFRRCAPATVSVETQPDAEGNISLGSGCVIDPAGVILTNHHVVEPALAAGQRVKVRFFDGREFSAKVVAADEEIDLALVHLIDSPGGLPILEFGDSDRVDVGDDSLAIGNPDGLSWSLSTGVISGKRGDLLQTTAPLNPGNSGGPLLSIEGQLIGINTYSMFEGRDNIAFSRASNDVKAWVAKASRGSGGGESPPERPPTRTISAEKDLSFVPPAGWSKTEPRGAGVRFRYVAPASDGGRSPGYIEVKAINRREYRLLEDLVEDVVGVYGKKYKEVEIGRRTIFDYAGGEENAGFLEVSYKAGRSGTIHLVESNFLVLGPESIHVVKFVVLASAWKGIQEAAYDAFRSVRWAGAGSKGTGPYSTPEGTVQAMVEAAVAGDVARFLEAVHPDLFYAELDARYARMDAHDRETFRKGVRGHIETGLSNGSMLGPVASGAVVLAGHRDGDRASARLVTTGDDGQKMVDTIQLALDGDEWKAVRFGDPKPFDPDQVQRAGGEAKRTTFKHPEGLFRLDYPSAWSTAENALEGGGTLFYFAPDTGGEEDLTERISIQILVRNDLSGYSTLEEEDLVKFRDAIEGQMGGRYQGLWQVAQKGAGTLSDLRSVHFYYVGMRTPISPVVQGKVTVTFRRGILYVVQKQFLNEGSGPVERVLQEIQDSIRIPG